jgi:hypothetical protein
MASKVDVVRCGMITNTRPAQQHIIFIFLFLFATGTESGEVYQTGLLPCYPPGEKREKFSSFLQH